MVKASTVVVEVGGKRNENWLFPPLRKSLRGRFSFRTAGPGAAVESQRYPSDIIPGQRIELDPDTGNAAVCDPIHEDEALKQAIVKQGFALPPAKEEYRNIDAATWTYWLWRAVQEGLAILVSGKLPETVERPKQKPRPGSVEEENTDLKARLARLEGQLQALLAKQG